jgi:hypothetical protein
MTEKRTDDTDGNQGEGNRAAAKHYNEGVEKFVRDGKVKAAAQDARKAVDGPERKELERAEAKGKSHARS